MSKYKYTTRKDAKEQRTQRNTRYFAPSYFKLCAHCVKMYLLNSERDDEVWLSSFFHWKKDCELSATADARDDDSSTTAGSKIIPTIELV